jgi:hypothetical protein
MMEDLLLDYDRWLMLYKVLQELSLVSGVGGMMQTDFTIG